MTEDFSLKTRYDSETGPPCMIKKKQVNTVDNNPITTREIFKNDTTSVEVIVKQVKNKKNIESSKHNVDTTINDDRLYEEIENLKREVNRADKNLENAKKCFRLVMFEIRKQLEVANQRELKRQTKCLVQQLENEKLKTMLESKTNLVRKLKKELVNVKRTIKLVTKGMRSIPLIDTSDLEYTEFESDLKSNIAQTSIVKSGDGHEFTYETTLSSKF